MLPSAAGGTDLYMSAGFRRLYPFYLRRNEEPIMKTGTIVAIILATAGAVIATVAFMQRKRKHAFCIDDEGPDCFADDSDAYCCEEAEDLSLIHI